MARKTRVTWVGKDEMIRRVGLYGEAIKATTLKVLEYYAPQVEAQAKQDAPWTDRTANARQTLFAQAMEVSKDVVSLYLSQKMDYGKWLELANGGKYQIVLPTLESFYNEIMQTIQDTLK